MVLKTLTLGLTYLSKPLILLHSAALWCSGEVSVWHDFNPMLDVPITKSFFAFKLIFNKRSVSTFAYLL